MAAALIPLAAAVAPAIVDLIVGLTHKSAPVQEANLGAKTGPVKMANLLEDVMVALQKAAAAGTIPKELPPDSIIATIAQAVVSSMKLSGLLDSSTQPAAPQTAQDVVLHAGQSIRITVG